MRCFFQTLTLCVVCGLLGGWAGGWTRREGRPEPTGAVGLSRKNEVPLVSAAPTPAPRGMSVTASMEWVREQMRRGDTGAVERLFHSEAGLTEAERLGLAKELVANSRRLDPRVLARVILGLPRGDEANLLLFRLIADWSGSDAEDALRFLETLPADRLNTVGVLHNAGFGLARLPVERVMGLAGRLDERGRAYLAEGLVGVADQVGSWRNTTAILSRLGAEPLKDAVSVEWQLGVNLAEIDPELLESQIAAETDATRREEMLGGYAWMVGINDPVRGVELDAKIQRPNIREHHLDRHVMAWLQSDRAAALAWLQGAAARQLMSREARVNYLRHYGLEAAP